MTFAESLKAEREHLARQLDAGEITHAASIVCSQCGAPMPNDAYARMYGRCARHADK